MFDFIQAQEELDYQNSVAASRYSAQYECGSTYACPVCGRYSYFDYPHDADECFDYHKSLLALETGELEEKIDKAWEESVTQYDWESIPF